MRGARRHLPAAIAASALVLSACVGVAPPVPTKHDVMPFSVNHPGRALPAGWEGWVIHRAKPKTKYDLVVDPLTGTVVLHAIADRSASGLRQLLDLDPSERPWIEWRWRVVDLIVAADNQDRHSEDAPVRLMLFFDGDRRTLSMREQMLAELAETLSGQRLPYATLMYVWENRFAPGTLLRSAHTSQVRMIVAGTGRDRIGTWKSFRRNYVDDYRRAFGTEPERLIGIGIMTDTDNTGESVEAFYGDIALTGAPP